MRVFVPLLLSLGCSPSGAPGAWMETGAPPPAPGLESRPGDAFLERHFDTALEICGPNTYYPDSVKKKDPWFDHMSQDCRRVLAELVGIQDDLDTFVDDSQWFGGADGGFPRPYKSYVNISIALYFLLYADLGTIEELPGLAPLDPQGLIRDPFVYEMRRFAAVHGYTHIAPLLFDLITSSIVTTESVENFEDPYIRARMDGESGHMQWWAGNNTYSPSTVQVLIHEAAHRFLRRANHVECAADAWDRSGDDVEACDEDFTKTHGMGLGVYGLFLATLGPVEDAEVSMTSEPVCPPEICVNEEYYRQMERGE